MSWLSDETVRHLQGVADLPDLEGARYDVLERIGSGGMGTVYRARDRDLERDVALKVLRQAPAADTLAARMLQEARILARLEHPGIVPVHDVGRLSDGRVWYAMKLVRGDRLDRHAARTAGLPERLRLFLRVCEAVAFAHAHGVVHRDLKPANVMIGPFGEVLVLDWGVAKVMGSGDLSGAEGVPDAEADTVVADPDTATDGETRPGTVLGTPGYMAPEQARGRSDLVGPRSDVYSLGGILDDLLAGSGSEPGSGTAPRPLRAIRDRARAQDPAERYAAVEELAADVSRFLDGSAVSAYREGAAERAARFVRKYRTPILLILGYVVIRGLVLLLAGT